MLKKFFLVIGLGVFALVANADIVNITYADSGHAKILARSRNTGENRWIAEIDIKKNQDNNLITIEKKGEGYFGSDVIYKTWRSHGTFNLIDNKMTPVVVKNEFYDKSGKIVNSVEKKYDAGTKKITCIVNGKEKVFDFPDDVVDDMDLALTMSNFPLERPSVTFHLLSLEPDLYSFTAKNLGTETINVNGVDKKCYKIKLSINMGIFGAFIPNTYFWVDVNPPHTFFRYQGLESGLNTPNIIIDRVE